MRELVTSALEVAGAAAVVAGVWGMFGWSVATVVGGVLALAGSFLAAD